MTRRHLVLVGIFFCLFCLDAIKAQERQDRLHASVAATRGHLAFLTQQHITDGRSRSENSPGERRTVEYIESLFTRLDLDYTRTDFSEMAGAHSFSNNIVARIDGISSHTLILATRLNTTRSQPHGDINIALILALAEWYGERPPPVSLLLLFLGAETDRQRLGSRLFLSGYHPETPTAALILDLSRAGTQPSLDAGTRQINSPAWIVRLFRNAARHEGLPAPTIPFPIQFIRRGLLEQDSAAAPFLNADIASIGIRSVAAPAADRYDLTDWLRVLHRFIDHIGEGIPSEWDRHWLTIAHPLGTFIINETTIVIVLMIIVGFSLLYFWRHPIAMGGYLRRLMSRLWQIPLAMVAIFLPLTISDRAVRGVLLLRRLPDLWFQIPAALSLLKAGIAIPLFALGVWLLDRHRPDKSARFYSIAAIALSLVSLFTIAALDISFAYLFIWSYAGSVIYALWRTLWKRLVTVIVSFLPLFSQFLLIHFKPYISISERILLPLPIDNLWWTIFLLPFLCMLLGLVSMRPPSQGRRLPRFLHPLPLVGIVGATVALGCMAFILLHNPFTENRPQPVTIEEIVEFPGEQHWLRLESPAPLGEMRLRFGDRRLNIATSDRTHRIELFASPPMMEIEETSIQFLNRRRYSLRIAPQFPAERIVVRLLGSEPLLIFDSSYPTTASPTEYSVLFHIGYSPSLPLDISYTLPDDIAFRTEVVARSPRLSQPISVDRDDIHLQTSFRAMYSDR